MPDERGYPEIDDASWVDGKGRIKATSLSFSVIFAICHF